MCQKIWKLIESTQRNEKGCSFFAHSVHCILCRSTVYIWGLPIFVISAEGHSYWTIFILWCSFYCFYLILFVLFVFLLICISFSLLATVFLINLSWVISFNLSSGLNFEPSNCFLVLTDFIIFVIIVRKCSLLRLCSKVCLDISRDVQITQVKWPLKCCFCVSL